MPGRPRGANRPPYEAADREACLALFDSHTPRFFDPLERGDFEQVLDEMRWPYQVIARDEPGATGMRLNTGALTTGFYERFGFVVERVVKDGYAPGGDRHDMRLSF